MSGRLLRRIVIAGGGSAGWMAAASLSHALGRSCAIELVESDAIGTVGVGEATIPPIRSYLRGLGISEADFLRATGATAKLGIRFDGWSRAGEHYFHPFGVYGVGFDQVPLHQWWLRERMSGDPGPLDGYSMAAALAAHSRFAPPLPDPRNVLSTYDYAYHLDAGLFAALLRREAETRGVVRMEGRILDIERDARGSIAALRLEGERRIAGDFFIDCTGFAALLIGQALGVKFDDWSHWLPCDSALAVGSAPLADLPPFTRSTADTAGWRWRIPLAHRTGNGHVFASAHIDTEAARDALLAGIDGEVLGEPRLLRFRTGRRRTPWAHNCVALGLAAGFMEPLESTSLHLVQAGITRLIALLPERDEDPLRIDEFNRLSREEWERIRDFLVLHYHLNDRDDPLWQRCRETQPPTELAWRLAHFCATARLVSPGPELFLNPSWLAVLVGQGAAPRAFDPLVSHRAQIPAAERLRTLRRVIAEAAKTAVSHDDWRRQSTSPS